MTADTWTIRRLRLRSKMSSFTTVLIGSHPDCFVRLDDPAVEPHHAQITRGLREEFSLTDLGPHGGTRIMRGERLLEVGAGTLLRVGDVIIVGRTKLIWNGTFE